MQANKVYDEVIDFIASSGPRNVIAFRPSEEVKASQSRRDFAGTDWGLSDEKSELDLSLRIEHLLRTAKIRAHYYLAEV